MLRDPSLTALKAARLEGVRFWGYPIPLESPFSYYIFPLLIAFRLCSGQALRTYIFRAKLGRKTLP